MKKEIVIGIITGILANTLGVILYILIFSDRGIDATIQQSLAEGFFGKIVTLGAVLNLIAFFLFIRKKQDYRARGVLMASILTALITFVLKFI